MRLNAMTRECMQAEADSQGLSSGTFQFLEAGLKKEETAKALGRSDQKSL